MQRYRKLEPAKFKPFSNKVYGFDVETYGENNDFYCASIYYNDEKKWTFFDQEELINFFKQPMFKNSFITATNLDFDFYAVFRKHPEEKFFTPTFRGSKLLAVKTYLHKEVFSGRKLGKRWEKVTFIDTLNYAMMSVEELGKILGIPKLEHPSCLGKIPQNEKEKQELIVYNMRDAEISKKMIDFLYQSFSELGASPKITIASTSMSLFRNKYLDKTYWCNSIPQILDQFKAYYGGRTEAFKRGKISEYNYYDVNSLYPSVMINNFPDPNSLRETRRDTLYYIENYEGISEVLINCPKNMDIPLLSDFLELTHLDP